MKNKLFILFLIMSFSMGCASIQRASDKERRDKWLAGLAGVLTYDQALVTWGPPLATADGDEIFVAQWASEKSITAIIPTQYVTFAKQVSHGWILRLTFNKTTKKLDSSYYYNW